MKNISIQCKGVNKTYGEGDSKVEALKNINLEIYSGELTLLIGPSGSGKTTLLSIITMILKPDNGELLLLGQDILKMNDEEKSLFCLNNLGIVFQSIFLIPTLTVLENVSVPMLIAGYDEKIANEKSMEVLKRFNIANRSHFPPTDISKGQQQRVGIARAIVNDSKIIICDEPTSALDHHSGYDVMGLLHELARDPEKTVLVVTHDQRIFPYADRIISILDGEITEGKENA